MTLSKKSFLEQLTNIPIMALITIVILIAGWGSAIYKFSVFSDKVAKNEMEIVELRKDANQSTIATLRNTIIDLKQQVTELKEEITTIKNYSIEQNASIVILRLEIAELKRMREKPKHP